MIHIFFAAGCSFILALIFTPLMIWLAKKKKIVDIPNERKSHTKPIPLLGGLAIHSATVITVILSILFFSKDIDYNIVIAFLIGITGVTYMGMIDDVLSLSAKRRLVILFILAIVVLVGCLQFYFGDRFSQSQLIVPITMSVFVVIWIVAITNAINFTDGLDGLASALSLVSAISFAIIFRAQGRVDLALPTSLALTGAILGFLPYNFSPAKIFMGDAGSMFIGFMLGIFSIMSISQRSIMFAIVPIFFMLVPILDMFISIFRRLLTNHSIMLPDKKHFHHKLNGRFKNHKIVVLILTAVQMLFAGFGLLIFFYNLYVFGWIAAGVVVFGLCIYTVITEKVKARE
jgi:UDP-GlcNAc:undecaprenyl-phosphate GlcNAc-1-phosphate transferase